MSTRRLLLATFAIGLLAIPSTARAGENPDFTVPLHAMDGSATSCLDYLPVDCITQVPNVNVAPGALITVFVFVANHTQLKGLQTAFEWNPGWDLLSGFWNCQSRQLNLVTPASPGGPTAGALITAFDCVTDPSLAVVGYMAFTSGTGGCIRQVNPSPGLVAVIDCAIVIDEFDAGDPMQQLRLGRICVNEGGHDACEPLATPVESATWGKIKSSYR